MLNISLKEVYDTIQMSEKDQFDVRTVTLNLLPCVHSNFKTFLSRVWEQIESKARNLKSKADQIAKEFGIPIVNKRITITPVSLIISNHIGQDEKENTQKCLELARTLDEVVKKLGIDFIGGFGGFIELGESQADKAIITALPEVLSHTTSVCSFLNVATTKQGINMDAIKKVAKMILATSQKSENAIGCAKFVVFSNAVPDSPFISLSPNFPKFNLTLLEYKDNNLTSGRLGFWINLEDYQIKNHLIFD